MKFNIFSGAKNFQRPTTPPPRRQKIFGQGTISGLKKFSGQVHCKCCPVTLPQFFIPKFENVPKKNKYPALYAEIFNPNISPAD
jgi:hypothetical protein